MIDTVKSNDTSISKILEDIDRGKNQLPDFQRGWVWDDDRIRALIASITNSYPVGALMFLEYGGDSVRFKYRPFTGAEAGGIPEMLVLDGQQRLTSIYCAMFCRKPVPTQTAKNEPVERFYYLDIENCLDSLDNRVIDRFDTILSIPADRMIRKNFNREIILDLSSRDKEFKERMFPLNIVFDHIASGIWMDDYREYHNYDKDILKSLQQFNARILVPIQNYRVPVIRLNKETPKEAVCQVFENVNTGGVSLTVFELVTATFAMDDFDLRSDWERRREMLKAYTRILTVISDVDFLVACTLLSRYHTFKNGGVAVSCKKQDILNLNLEDYKKYADMLVEGFKQSAQFLMEQRIFFERDLPYTTQFIPLSVLFAILDKRAQDSTVRNKLVRWYWCGVMGEMYGSSNETRYANDVTGIMEWLDGKSEPDTIVRSYFPPLRLLSLQSRNSAAYKGIMALILKSKAVDFISGKEMDFTVFSDEQIDIHHIFPKAYCVSKNIKAQKYNSIVNKTPLSARTNRIIGGNAPGVYLKKIEHARHVTETDLNTYVATHHIDIRDLREDCFDTYFLKRAKALLRLIGDVMGKPVMNLDDEDIVAAFGGSLK